MRYSILFIGLLLIFTSCTQAKKERKETKPSLQKVDVKSLTNYIGMKMIYLSDGYWVSAYETTKKEYYKIILPVKKIHAEEENLPVNPSSEEAIKYCEELTKYEKEHGILPIGYIYSLPTEKMWRDYVADAKFEDAVFNRYYEDKPQKVGSRSPNRLGLYDVRGNVNEWMIDWYYSDNKTGGRALRGGSFLSSTMNEWDVDNRSGLSGPKSCNVGFRVVLIPNSGSSSEPVGKER